MSRRTRLIAFFLGTLVWIAATLALLALYLGEKVGWYWPSVVGVLGLGALIQAWPGRQRSPER